MVGLLRTGRDPLLAAPEFQEISALTAEPLLLVDRIAGHLARLADGQRLLIAVDDVQWADRVSRYALRALISRLVGIPCRVGAGQPIRRRRSCRQRRR